MSFSNVYEMTMTKKLVIVEKKSPSAQVNDAILRPMAKELGDKGEKVIYIPSERQMPNTDEIKRVLLARRLSEDAVYDGTGLPIDFVSSLGFDVNDPFFFTHPGGGAINVLNILMSLKDSDKETTILIEDPGRSLHSMAKRQIIKAIDYFFPAKTIIVSTWHDEILDKYPNSIVEY